MMVMMIILMLSWPRPLSVPPATCAAEQAEVGAQRAALAAQIEANGDVWCCSPRSAWRHPVVAPTGW